MEEPQTKSEYQSIVSDLVDEFSQEIESGAARSVANHIIAAFRIQDGQPVILDAVEYEGGPIESLDTCLNPYSVLRLTDQDALPAETTCTGGGYNDPAAGRAAEVLTLDLQDEHRGRE